MKILAPERAVVLEACAGRGRNATDAELTLARALAQDGLVTIEGCVTRGGHKFQVHVLTPAGERVLRIHRAWQATGLP